MGLRDELETELVVVLGRDPSRPEPLRRFARWSTDWARRFDQARERCHREPPLARVYDDLRALHEAYDRGVQQIGETRAALTSSVDASLEELALGVDERP